MTITEFLEARISADESEARQAITERERATPHEGADTGLQSWPDSPVPAVLVGPERVLAECEAKRSIVAMYKPEDAKEESWEPEAYMAGAYDDCMRALAKVYNDHPDYQQEWAPRGV